MGFHSQIKTRMQAQGTKLFTQSRLFWTYLLFWFLCGITQFMIAASGAGSWEGFKDATITAWLWLAPVLVFPAYVHRWVAVAGVLVWLTALPGFGYFLIYRQELTQSLMMIIFESNRTESAEYLQNYFSFKILLGFLLFTAIPLYLWAKIKSLPGTDERSVFKGALIVSLIFFTPVKKAFSEQSMNAGYKNAAYHLSVAPPWQLALGYHEYQTELKEVENNLLNLKKIPPLPHLKESAKPLPTTVVLVIGESTNRLHMGLYGYARDTNPKLQSIRNELVLFDNVFASRPNTIESLQQVLTFANQQHPDWYKTTPSLISLMKQAGYKTYWITNQQTLTARNTMLTTFAKQADKQVFLNTSRRQNAYSFDEKVLPPYMETLAKPDEKKLIVVHLLGTHMKYAYRYPESHDYFKDHHGVAASLSADKVQTVNEYDNAIRYNDKIVYQLITTLKKQQQHSLLVYFSDHGDDVYDSATHDFQGRNEASPTYPMYAIPFIVWHSKNWFNADKLHKLDIAHRQYNNANFIHTWSDLLGLQYDGFLSQESIVSDQFAEDAILVGNPYHRHLQPLGGTKRVSEAAAH